MKNFTFAAFDAGGAIALRHVIEHILRLNHSVVLVAAGPAEQKWKCLSDKVKKVFFGGNCYEQASNLRQALLSADVLITGTSHFSNLEREAWALAVTVDVLSIAFIDSWTNVSARFRQDGLGSTVFPRSIFVVDDLLENAVSETLEGFEGCICKVGHPSLSRLINVNHIRRDHIEKVIYFSSKNTDFLIYEKMFLSVIEWLSISGVQKLVVKVHPSEDKTGWDVILNFWRKKTKIELVVVEEDINIREYDLALGIETLALIESSLCGCPSIAINFSQSIDALLSRAYDAYGVKEVHDFPTFQSAFRQYSSNELAAKQFKLAVHSEIEFIKKAFELF